MSRASGLRKIADAQRLLDEGLRELAEAFLPVGGSDPLPIEKVAPVKVTEMDVARARARLRKGGFDV